MAKHFFKTLVIFIIMIIIGLLGIFLINHFSNEEQPVSSTNPTQVAK
jgi:cell division protein YceG involved in septum cleavage